MIAKGAHEDDQDKALRFYTDVLGFAKKADFRQGPAMFYTDDVKGDCERIKPQNVRTVYGPREWFPHSTGASQKPSCKYKTGTAGRAS